MSIANRIVLDRIMTESVAPTVTTTVPADTASGISCTDNITVTFIEGMDTASVTTNTDNTSCYGTIQVSQDNFVSCAQMTSVDPITSDNKTFGVKLATSLSSATAPPTAYKIRVTTGVTDPSGNPMSDNDTTVTGFYTAGKGASGSGCT
jgi:hypothetical protein